MCRGQSASEATRFHVGIYQSSERSELEVVVGIEPTEVSQAVLQTAAFPICHTTIGGSGGTRTHFILLCKQVSRHFKPLSRKMEPEGGIEPPLRGTQPLCQPLTHRHRPDQSQVKWRRRRDSNSRNHCWFTAFPRQRIRPLCHVSVKLRGIVGPKWKWRIAEDLHPRPVKVHAVFEAAPARLSGLLSKTVQRNAWESNPVDPCGSYGLANRCITILPALR